MASRVQVQDLLDGGHTFETAGRELGIPAGRAFMIATGLPADGTGVHGPGAPGGAEIPASTQGLVNPRPFNPLGRAHVMPWVRSRAARELEGGDR